MVCRQTPLDGSVESVHNCANHMASNEPINFLISKCRLKRLINGYIPRNATCNSHVIIPTSIVNLVMEFCNDKMHYWNVSSAAMQNAVSKTANNISDRSYHRLFKTFIVNHYNLPQLHFDLEIWPMSADLAYCPPFPNQQTYVDIALRLLRSGRDISFLIKL
eukprot:713397_1